MPRLSLTKLLKLEKPLRLPVAHDALSARMIERAGFKAISIGGSGISGCRLGLPDLGLATFTEISNAVRDIATAVNCPLIVDADDGYGDVKNMTRTVQVYEQMGVAAISIEDQMSPKKCGHMKLKRRLISSEEMEYKLTAALDARKNDDIAIIARTDACGVEGLDATLERGRRYVATGVDALFVEAPRSVEELRLIGETFRDIPLMVNAAEGGITPILSTEEYRSLGFSIIIYPSTLMLRMIDTFDRTLVALREGIYINPDQLPEFTTMTEILGLNEWMEVDRKFGPILSAGDKS